MKSENIYVSSRRTLFMKGPLDSNSKNTKEDIIEMLEFLVDEIFVGFAGKFFFQRDSRHSIWYTLCPSPSRHISVLVRIGIIPFLLFVGRKRLHIYIHLLRFVHL